MNKREKLLVVIALLLLIISGGMWWFLGRGSVLPCKDPIWYDTGHKAYVIAPSPTSIPTFQGPFYASFEDAVAHCPNK